MDGSKMEADTTDASKMDVSPQLEPEPYDATDLKKLLDSVNPVGSFATTGTFTPSALSPKVVVDGVGTIGLPLHPLVANALKEKATKAPFGRGPETLVDETVRRSWQFDPDKVSVSGDNWEQTMAKVVQQAAYKLGISNENVKTLGIKANLYKVLLYEKGGFFKPHKDTVKEEGMFATLVIQLPSSFSGCMSKISHQGETKELDMATNSESTFCYTAFYADCEHEILPVEEGWRFCLVYNLVVTKPSSAGVVPDANQMRKTETELQIEVAKWLLSSTGKLGYPLDHEYTLDSFRFGSLKGRDAVVMSALRHAKDETGARLFDLALAIFFHKEYRGGYDGNQEYGIEKILLEDGTSRYFQKYYGFGSKKPTSTSPVWVEHMLYQDNDGFFKEHEDLSEEEQENVSDAKDDGELKMGAEHEAWTEHHDAGNEGGGYTTWYRSACLIFLPTSQDVTGTIASLCTTTSGDGAPDKKKMKV